MASLVPLALLLAGSLCRRAGATDYEVGGDGGWAVPSTHDEVTYTQWASKNRFLVGDSVHFKYKTDSVMSVTEDEYNDCRSAHPIFFANNGDTDVRLDRLGYFYFISGVAGLCQRGQRMIIKVIGRDAPPPAPQGASPPPPPVPPSPPHPSGAAPGTAALAGAIADGVAGRLMPCLEQRSWLTRLRSYMLN